ncbi:MAG: hypothetical protein PVF70_06875 [Anaerolineales bacterium]|jgi:hypothetical protein
MPRLSENAASNLEIAYALALLRDWYYQYRKIARVALRGRRQLLEKLGIPARTSRTKRQAAALRRRRAPDPAFEQP